ncbi:MAG: choice-of-anchor V domain-containing protein [Steroidobacteraceae bacterium]
MRSSTRRNRAVPATALVAALLLAPALLALHFRDGPPAQVTGGFGGDSCIACHSGYALNDGTGQLTLEGFPERYTPGTTYDLELTLSRIPAIAAAGFQLAVRLADSTQAGTIQVPAEQPARITLLDERGVQYAHHRLAEPAPAASETVRWKLSWSAPEAAGQVFVHAAAVAGDGDESQTGDHVYTLEKTAGQSGGD